MKQKLLGPSMALAGLMGASFAGLGNAPAFGSLPAPSTDRHPRDQDQQAKDSRPTVSARQFSNRCTSAVQQKAGQQFQTHAIVFRSSGIHDTMWGDQKRVEGMFEI